MNSEKSIPNIFSYNNFRTYLHDYQVQRRSWDPAFNKSNISRLLGLPNTRSFFTDVLSGRRPVSGTYIERFIRLLNLDLDESRYFRALIKFNQADNNGDREMYFDQLIALNKTPCRTLTKDLYRYFKEWHHNVIRAMLDVFDICDDYAAIATKVVPPITIRQAEDSIRLLESLGLIAKNEKGFYKPTEKTLVTPEFVQDELVLQYQMSCFKIAHESIRKSYKQPKHVSTNTISISHNGYKRLQKQIHKFRAQVRSLVHKDETPAETVYQICLAAFPVVDGGA